MSTMPYKPPLRFQPRTFTLHNASTEKYTIRWGGLTFTLPPVDKVGPKAAHYADGRPIPGTCVLADSATFNADGTIGRNNWRAEDAIRNVLGINPDTGEALGPAAKAGISFLPDDPTEEMVREVREDGERRWNAHLIGWAEKEVATFKVAIERSKDAGAAPPTPDASYRRAVHIIERYHRDLGAKFGLPAEEVVEKATHEDEIEMEVYLKAKAIQMAERAAAEMEVDKAKVAEDLLQDPKIRKHLQRLYRIRKIGRTEEDSFTEEARATPPQSIDVPELRSGEPPGEE